LVAFKPTQIVCAILTYRKHLQEWEGNVQAERKIPQFIVKSASSLNLNGRPVLLPDLREAAFDPPWGWVSGEVELAMVVKKRAHHVKSSDAEKYIAGYTILNDVTQRDLEKTMGYPYSMTKSFPTFGPVGPKVVPRKALGDPNDLQIQMRVNGRTVQKARTSELMYPVEEIFHWASHLFVLNKGDIVSTGTCEGPLSYRLQPGDIMECEIENIGILRNPVVDKLA